MNSTLIWKLVLSTICPCHLISSRWQKTLKQSPKLRYPRDSSLASLIMDDFTDLDSFPIFKDFIRIPEDKMTLLGASIPQGQALDEALQIKVDELQKAIHRLKLLRAHDALLLLKNSISIPKLLYLLRTSNCYNLSVLLQFDTILKSGLSTILNVDFNETQWIQATLLVNDGGLGIRCATTLATSVFLASAASTHSLQQSILPSSHNQMQSQDLVSIEAIWSSLSSANTPDQQVQRFQKAWDSSMVKIYLKPSTRLQHQMLTELD